MVLVNNVKIIQFLMNGLDIVSVKLVTLQRGYFLMEHVKSAQITLSKLEMEPSVAQTYVETDRN